MPKKPGTAKYEEFGKRLRYIMARRRIEPGRLRDLMGVADGSTISRWQAGTAKPKGVDLLRLAEVLKVEVNDLEPGFAPPGLEVREPSAAGYGAVNAPDLVIESKMTVDQMLAGLDLNTAEPSQVLRAAGAWVAERLTTDREKTRAHELLGNVFDAGARSVKLSRRKDAG